MQFRFERVRAAALFSAISSISFAQGPNPSAEEESTSTDQALLQEIVVTAQRRTEPLQTVPEAVTALTADTLRQAGVTNTEGLAEVTPSFGFSEFVGRSDQVSMSIRGQHTSDMRLTNDGAVIPYIAEIPVARPYGIGIVGFLDVQSVEVVKGPQGTLFGRNTTGGAVLITPNTPGDQLEANVTVDAGNYKAVSTDAVVNIPIADGIGVRFAGTAGHHDGYIENRGPFPALYGEDYQGGRMSFQVKRDALTSTFYGDALAYTNSGLGGILTAANPVGLGNLLPLPGGGALNAEVAEQQASNFWSARTSVPTGAWTHVYGISNTTEYRLSDALLLKNIASYRRVATDAVVDVDGTPYTILVTDLPARAHQETEELQAQYTAERFHVIGGAFYFDEKGVNGGYTDVLKGLAFRTTYNEPVHNTSKSVFAQGTYDFTDRLHLTVGGRETWDQRQYDPSIYQDYTHNVVVTPNPGVICVETGDNGLPLPGCRAHASASFNKATYNVTGQYQFSRTQQVYASVRTGYRTGGFNTGSQTPSQLVPYEPETVTNYEVGFKGDFNLSTEVALRFNAAVYYQDYKNIQKSTNYCLPGVSPCDLVARIQNAATARIDGFELESTLVLPAGFEVGSFYSYTEAKYKSWLGVNGLGQPEDLSSSPFGYLPKSKVGVNVRYRYELPKDQALELQANVSYQSAEWLDDIAPAPGLEQKGYALTNLRANWVLSPTYTLSLWGKNVFDRHYFVSGDNVYNSIGFTTLYPGIPVTFGLELNAKF